MDKNLLRQKYLESHDGLVDDYLDIIIDIYDKFPDFKTDLDFLFRGQVSADFALMIKDNLNSVEKTHKALEFIKQLYDRPQDKWDAVSEDFACALKSMLEDNKVDIKSLNMVLQEDIHQIFENEGFLEN